MGTIHCVQEGWDNINNYIHVTDCLLKLDFIVKNNSKTECVNIKLIYAH